MPLGYAIGRRCQRMVMEIGYKRRASASKGLHDLIDGMQSSSDGRMFAEVVLHMKADVKRIWVKFDISCMAWVSDPSVFRSFKELLFTMVNEDDSGTLENRTEVPGHEIEFGLARVDQTATKAQNCAELTFIAGG